jgi:hypothetical protein
MKKRLYFASSEGDCWIVIFCEVKLEEGSGQFDFSKAFQQDAKYLKLAKGLARKA